jgi:hypothetical protein
MSPSIAYSLLFHDQPRQSRWPVEDHQVIAAAIREAAARHPHHGEKMGSDPVFRKTGV